jgi:hypothetical protein
MRSSFAGEMGFIKIPRGNNYLSIEACDCWYAVPTWDMEKGVASGTLQGTMYGVVQSKDKHELQKHAEEANDEDGQGASTTIVQRARANLVQQMLRAQEELN